jgi:tetratricopeptide (TPR) repeat protein
MAIADSFMREGSWTNAIHVLTPWVASYATNHAAAPRAEFDLAWASEQAGIATNSVTTFRTLVSKYPNHYRTPTILLLLGDRYSARGDFANAEQAYITIYTNTLWKATSAQQQAYLGAAQSALARRSPSTARERLTTLINDPSCPTNLLAEAFFWLGSAWYDEVPESRTNVVGNFVEAINAFSKVAQFSPTHDRTPKAWCLIGQCALQIAGVDPKFYATASTNFVKTLNSNADITWRSRAKVGLANVSRKTGQPDAALALYQDVYYGKLRNPNEDIDPYWTWTAGIEAYQLNLELGRKEDAIKVYERLGEIFPSRKPLLEKELKLLK